MLIYEARCLYLPLRTGVNEPDRVQCKQPERGASSSRRQDTGRGGEPSPDWLGKVGRWDLGRSYRKTPDPGEARCR